MLFRQRFLDGIRDGSITLAFRSWHRPSVKTGGTLLTPIGQLEIKSVGRATLAEITAVDAKRAGYDSRRSLIDELATKDGGDLYRIELGRLKEDPRVALRKAIPSGTEELQALSNQLARLDARSPTGEWTRATLEIIAEHPGVRAAALARKMGQEKEAFKTNVRKLKRLGLTESLEIGYRISPRGHALLD